jgi:hypothetical protein
LAANVDLDAPLPTRVELDPVHSSQDVDPLWRVPELDDCAFLEEVAACKAQRAEPEVLQR